MYDAGYVGRNATSYHKAETRWWKAAMEAASKGEPVGGGKMFEAATTADTRPMDKGSQQPLKPPPPPLNRECSACRRPIVNSKWACRCRGWHLMMMVLFMGALACQIGALICYCLKTQ